MTGIRRLLTIALTVALCACETTLPPSFGSSSGPIANATPSASAPPSHAVPSPSSAPSPTPEQSDPPIPGCGDVIATSEPKSSSTKPVAVIWTEEGVGLYDIGADSVMSVKTADELPGYGVRFRTPTQVTFVRGREPSDEAHTFGQESLYELDLKTNQAQELIRLPNHVLAFEWSPDGSVLAYLVAAETERRGLPSPLCLFDSLSGVTTQIKSLSYTIGRGGNQWDERSIAWSPNGTRLLVLDTVQSPPLYVVDLDGRNVIRPRAGTFARWLSDERIVYLENPNDAFEPWRWRTVSTASGRVSAFPLAAGTFRAAFSPNGQFIAFDDGAKVPSVYLFDLETRESHLLAHGYVAPLWLGPRLIAATSAGRCPRSYFCVIPWLPTDETIGIDPKTGEREALSLPTTLQDGFANGAIDVLLART